MPFTYEPQETEDIILIKPKNFSINIDLKTDFEPIISEKDKIQPTLKEAIK